MAVSAALLALIIIAGGKSGASLNPAIGLAQTCFEVANFSVRDEYRNYYWVYTIGPFLGGALAGIIHKGHLHAFGLMNSI